MSVWRACIATPRKMSQNNRGPDPLSRERSIHANQRRISSSIIVTSARISAALSMDGYLLEITPMCFQFLISFLRHVKKQKLVSSRSNQSCPGKKKKKEGLPLCTRIKRDRVTFADAVRQASSALINSSDPLDWTTGSNSLDRRGIRININS